MIALLMLAGCGNPIVGKWKVDIAGTLQNIDHIPKKAAERYKDLEDFKQCVAVRLLDLELEITDSELELTCVWTGDVIATIHVINKRWKDKNFKTYWMYNDDGGYEIVDCSLGNGTSISPMIFPYGEFVPDENKAVWKLTEFVTFRDIEKPESTYYRYTIDIHFTRE